AKQLGVKADGLGFGVLCGKVWAKVKEANAPTQAKVDAAPQTGKSDAPKSEPYAAGTPLIADGKGGVKIASKADLLAALANAGRPEQDGWKLLENAVKPGK